MAVALAIGTIVAFGHGLRLGIEFAPMPRLDPVLALATLASRRIVVGPFPNRFVFLEGTSHPKFAVGVLGLPNAVAQVVYCLAAQLELLIAVVLYNRVLSGQFGWQGRPRNLFLSGWVRLTFAR